MKMFIKYKDKYSGLTLIELMTVLAIIGILSSIAIPLFDSQSRKKNRAVAISSILQARAHLEKCFLNNQPNGYNGCNLNALVSVDTKNLYTITPVFTRDANNIETSYILTADENSGADTECLSFSISNVGIKTNDGTGSLQRCWTQ